MPIWCPKCHGMLPDGLEECPGCGAKLGSSQENETLSNREILLLSFEVLKYALLPLVVVIIIGALCVLLGK
jgi:hypothetical protein